MSAGAEVLVVGAGPSGLLAAVELARHGVPARLVERSPAPHRQARATAIQPGTLEILAAAGVAERFLAASEHLGFARVFDDQLRPLSESSFAGTGGRWEFQCSLPQWRTEQILAGRLAELGGRVERGVSVVSLEPGQDEVLARLEHAGGGTETARARWVIGAGGAHSVVRQSLDEELTGQTYPGLALAADVAVSCGLPRDGGALIATPAGYVLLAPLPGGRWITFVGDLDQAEQARLDESGAAGAAELVREALQRRAGDAVRVDDVGWAAQFRMHRRQAPYLAGRRRFLLGDAGHLSSPFGGEGLNSGLHDAHNLAWKLALEVQGRARPGLLASYAAERGAAAGHVIETSDQVHELAHGAVDAVRTGVPGRPLTPGQAAALARARAMLDTSYAGGALAGQSLGPGAAVPAGPGPGDRYPDRVMLPGPRHHLLLFGPPLLGAPPGDGIGELGRRWRGLVDVVPAGGDPRRAGLGGSGAVLVRPDGYIGFRAAPAGPAALAAVDQHLSRYLIPA